MICLISAGCTPRATSIGRKRESRYKKRALQTLLEIEVKGREAGRSDEAAIFSQSTR